MTSFKHMALHSAMTGMAAAIAFDLDHLAAYIMFVIIFAAWVLRMYKWMKEDGTCHRG